jgi:hypothetical protein
MIAAIIAAMFPPPVAVVGSAQDSDKVLIFEKVDIPFLHDLMGSSNQLQPIDTAKVIGDL